MMSRTSLQKLDLRPPRLAQMTRTRPSSALLTKFGVAITIVLYSVSGGLLWLVGYNYEGVTGGAPTKIHPATYLTVIAIAVAAAASGDPIGYLRRRAELRPASLFLLIAMLGLFVQTVTHNAPGMAGSLETFLGPALLVMLFVEIDERGLDRIETVVHVLMIANAVMALVEFGLNQRFFPYRFDGQIFVNDTRSSALQGHPLVNATVTAVYCLALLTGGRPMSSPWKMLLFMLQSAALVTYGGRSAIVVTLLLGGGYLLVASHRTLRAGRVPILAAASVLLILAIAPIAAGGLATSGFFDALVTRFTTNDGGSANARVAMFDLFDNLSVRDLIAGPDPALIESRRRIAGLEWGIENPVIKTLLYQGGIITILMTLAVTLFLREVGQSCRRGIWLPLLGFVLLLNTAETISGKTNIISKVVVMMLCMYRPRAPFSQFAGRVSPSELTITGSSPRVASSMRPMPSKRFQNAQPNPNASAASRTSRI